MHNIKTTDGGIDIENLVLEHCNDLIVVLDSGFKIIINLVAENIFHISKNVAIGQNLFGICKDNQIKLSFTEKNLEELKIIVNKLVVGGYVEYLKERSVILWKQIFIDDKQKNHGYFLIFGKDVSILEKYKQDGALASAYLSNILEALPEYIYWKDLNLIYLGCSRHVSDSLGLMSSDDIIGKSDLDFGWSEERVKALREIDKKIIETKIPSIVEEVIPQSYGSAKTVLSSKTPLINSAGKIIGIIGISVDITTHKEAERLKLETEAQKAKLAEQEKFKK